jgi:hypothetical protein
MDWALILIVFGMLAVLVAAVVAATMSNGG